MRAKGLLQYVGKHHLRFAGMGEYFIKCGADAPENFLAYQDFDSDFKHDGQKDNLVKDWAPHIQDCRPGEVYLVYLQQGGDIKIDHDLEGHSRVAGSPRKWLCACLYR